MSANGDKIRIEAYAGPYSDSPAEHPEGTFIDRIKDPSVRSDLAVHVSSNGFYGKLDRGDEFDEAFDTSMHLAIANRRLLDSFVELGEIPDTTWPESSWHAALDAMQKGERPNYEAGKIRKALAGFILRQELITKNYVINLTPWRKRSPTASSGIIQ